MRRLEGKTAMITGCNRGIGLAILKRFAEEGSNIIACTRNQKEEFSSICRLLESKYNISITNYFLDLSDEDNLKTGLKEICKNHKAIDILVNNAGIAAGGLMIMTGQKKLKEVFQINYFAQVQITQAVLKNMMKNKEGGSIIFMSSVLGLDAKAGGSAYGASKAAVAFLTGSLAKEVGPFGIRINAIAPNLIATDMAAQMEEGAKNDLTQNSALKRIGEVREVANTALFLASDESSYITGQVIRVDGGL